MRGSILFAMGILVGVVAQGALAQNQPVVVGLNHVGIAAPDVAEASAYYQAKLGFKEAFKNTDAQGKVTQVYLQISRNTFLEIQEVNAQRPAGVNHFGLEVGSIEQAVAFFRKNGATSSDPTGPSAFSRARLANVTAPGGIRVELSELGPESLQRKAMESWK